MGNIRPTYIKRIAKKLINTYPDKFVASDFQDNKEKVAELADFNSKILRNRIAGYLYYKTFSISKEGALQ